MSAAPPAPANPTMCSFCKSDIQHSRDGLECTQCASKPLCQMCVIPHTKAGHKVLDLNGEEPELCSHHKSIISHVCSPCKTLVCHFCSTEALHQQHPLETLESVAQKKRVRIDQLMRTSSNFTARFEKKSAELQKTVEEFISAANKDAHEITVEKIIEKLRPLVERAVENRTKSIKLWKESLNNELAIFKDLIEKTDASFTTLQDLKRKSNGRIYKDCEPVKKKACEMFIELGHHVGKDVQKINLPILEKDHSDNYSHIGKVINDICDVKAPGIFLFRNHAILREVSACKMKKGGDPENFYLWEQNSRYRHSSQRSFSRTGSEFLPRNLIYNSFVISTSSLFCLDIRNGSSSPYKPRDADCTLLHLGLGDKASYYYNRSRKSIEIVGSSTSAIMCETEPRAFAASPFVEGEFFYARDGVSCIYLCSPSDNDSLYELDISNAKIPSIDIIYVWNKNTILVVSKSTKVFYVYRRKSTPFDWSPISRFVLKHYSKPSLVQKMSLPEGDFLFCYMATGEKLLVSESDVMKSMKLASQLFPSQKTSIGTSSPSGNVQQNIGGASDSRGGPDHSYSQSASNSGLRPSHVTPLSQPIPGPSSSTPGPSTSRLTNSSSMDEFEEIVKECISAVTAKDEPPSPPQTTPKPSLKRKLPYTQ